MGKNLKWKSLREKAGTPPEGTFCEHGVYGGGHGAYPEVCCLHNQKRCYE
jgi:hypothetical protein